MFEIVPSTGRPSDFLSPSAVEKVERSRVSKIALPSPAPTPSTITATSRIGRLGAAGLVEMPGASMMSNRNELRSLSTWLRSSISSRSCSNSSYLFFSTS